MLIHEVTSPLTAFVASVRVKTSSSSTTAKTLIYADGLNQARAILGRIYGTENVMSVAMSGPIDEDGTKVMSSGEQQVKALADQSGRLQQQAKQLKARQAVTKAQQSLAKVATVKPGTSK